MLSAPSPPSSVSLPPRPERRSSKAVPSSRSDAALPDRVVPTPGVRVTVTVSGAERAPKASATVYRIGVTGPANRKAGVKAIAPVAGFTAQSPSPGTWSARPSPGAPRIRTLAGTRPPTRSESLASTLITTVPEAGTGPTSVPFRGTLPVSAAATGAGFGAS